MTARDEAQETRATENPAVSFVEGRVERVTDPLHVDVTFGTNTYPVTVPSNLVGACREGSQVRVQVSRNSRVLSSVRFGAWVGRVEMYSGGSLDVPAGYELMDGRTIADMATRYPLLYAHLGTTTLPDVKDRFVLGAGGDRAAGDVGGSAVITEGQMPRHDHGIWDNSGSGVANGSTTAYITNVNNEGARTGDAGNDEEYWPPFYALAFVIKAV